MGSPRRSQSVGAVDRLVVGGAPSRPEHGAGRTTSPAAIATGHVEARRLHGGGPRPGRPRLHDDASIVLSRRPRQGPALPGLDHRDDGERGVDGLVRTLVGRARPDPRQRAPSRASSATARTGPGRRRRSTRSRSERPPGRLVTDGATSSDAAVFLLENPSMNGTELRVDGGWSLPTWTEPVARRASIGTGHMGGAMAGTLPACGIRRGVCGTAPRRPRMRGGGRRRDRRRDATDAAERGAGRA